MHPCRNKWQQKWLALDITQPALQRLADEAENFCSRWYRNHPTNSLLVIVGDYGSGKTHVANKIHNFAVKAAFNAYSDGKWGSVSVPSAMKFSWPEECVRFNEKNFSTLEDMTKAELVVLDDIGAENDPWKICADKLCQVLSRREFMFTVVTTNIQPQHWAEKFDGRINDRLLRNSKVVDITGVGSFATR